MRKCPYISVLLFLVILLLTSCKYQKGDMYMATSAGDSLRYVVMATGKGENISGKAHKLKSEHLVRGDSCLLRYLTDSAALNNQKGILLFNLTLPDVKDDILTQGYFGMFSSKRVVQYVLISYDDLDSEFNPVERVSGKK